MMIMELPQSLVPIARTYFLHQEQDDCEFGTDLIYVDRETTPCAEAKSTEVFTFVPSLPRKLIRV